jgi:DNA-binding HxlR family transcriptional regulator
MSFEVVRMSDVDSALRLLSGRWKLLIVFHIYNHGAPLRFSALQRTIPAITHKMLTQQLKSLQSEGLLERHVRSLKPLHVEYGLTPLGAALRPALESLTSWAALKAEIAPAPTPVRSMPAPSAHREEVEVVLQQGILEQHRSP